MFKMITIQLNENCCIRCPYCFAGNSRARTSNNQITEENFRHFVDFCKLNSVDMVRVTGGEPFLHPHVYEMLAKLKNFQLNILTNLVVPHCVEKMNPQKGRVAFLVNYNDRELYTERQWEALQKNLKELKKREITVVLGYNVYKPDFDMTEVIRKTKELGSQRLRLSIANPSMGGKTQVLKLEEIREAVHKLTQISKKLWDETEIDAFFDCPIAPCLVEQEDYKYMVSMNRIRNQCSPMLFVKSDLTLSHCYTTDELRDSIYLKECEDFQTAKIMSEQLYKKIQNKVESWKQCKTCTNIYRTTDICGCFANYSR